MDGKDPPSSHKAITGHTEPSRLGDLVSHRFFSPLVRFFRRRGFQTPEAEDGAQEVFARLSGLEADNRIDNPKAYLFRVAASVAADQGRRARVRHQSMHTSADNLELGAEEPSSERVLIMREDLARLMTALEDMPPRRREILLLNRLDGLSYSQLAVRYGVSVSAIEKQMMKAIAHIHERMDANITGEGRL